jgi:AraC family transcriptional regulator
MGYCGSVGLEGGGSMLTLIAGVSAPNCKFEILEGMWPKPVEHRSIRRDPVLAMMFTSPNYRMEARVADAKRPGFGYMGNTFMVLPDREFVGRGTGGPVRVAHCVFDREAFRSAFGRDFDLSDSELDRALDVRSPTIAVLMRRLVQEANDPGFGSELLVESISNILVLECRREILKDQLAVPRTGQGLSQDHLKLIEQILERRAVGVPSIQELANACEFSGDYFARLFRTAVGQSIGGYIAAWRLRRAEQLLLQTNLPLKDIAFRLGFGNAAYFSTAFKKATRHSPREFRAQRSDAKMRREQILSRRSHISL